MKKIVKKKNYCIENTCNKSITGFIVVNVFTPSIKNPEEVIVKLTSSAACKPAGKITV